ncbi:MAG: hypothetical protein Q8P48_10965, partial [Deltaproteobacteria bacterium]|nr:hypothetical protein [Deltaproteobacteria bacterium]
SLAPEPASFLISSKPKPIKPHMPLKKPPERTFLQKFLSNSLQKFSVLPWETPFLGVSHGTKSL